MSITGAVRRHPAVVAVTIVVLGLAGFALYWFAPWNLVVDRRVDEALPTAARVPADPRPNGAATDEPRDDPAAVASDVGGGSPGEPVVLAEGRFRSLEHPTTGTALVLRLADGGRVLRLEDLQTSNGPDLRVIVTDRPISEDWHVWDDGAYVDLGALKGNLGSSNYHIPDDVRIDRYRTAVVWCRRFSVGFGVASIATG